MPRLSDTMTEGTIAKWLKHPGDEVKKGEILLEIETDKATMELEAYESGVVEKVLVDEGQTVPIGQPIMLIGDGSGAGEETGGGEAKADAPAAAEAPAASGETEKAPGAPAEGSGTGAAGTVTQGATAPGQDMTGARPAEAGQGDTQASTDAPKRSEQAPAEPQRS